MLYIEQASCVPMYFISTTQLIYIENIEMYFRGSHRCLYRQLPSMTEYYLHCNLMNDRFGTLYIGCKSGLRINNIHHTKHASLTVHP